MKQKYVLSLLFISVFFLFSCGQASNNPDSPNVPKDKAKLKSLKIGTYVASNADIEEASKEAGFSKVFSSDVESVEIVAVAEDGGSVDFGTYGNTITLTEAVQEIVIKVKKAGKNDSVYKLKLSKEAKAPVSELNNLQATDFMGILPLDVAYNVINSDVTWDAFEGATHYEVFIGDKRTNDVDGDGPLTKTKFRTATGLVDLDELMGDVEKEVVITVKALNSEAEMIASSSITKILPKKSGLKSVLFNDVAYSQGIKVRNPLTIKVAFSNNKIRFAGDSSKFDTYVKTNLVVEEGENAVPSAYNYDEDANIITITASGGLNENKSYKFVIKKGFSDIFNMNYEKEQKEYSFSIEKSTEPVPAPDVLKVLINDDPNLEITTEQKTGINVESTVAIYFNQLIDTTSYMPAVEGDDGRKGNGIYITTKEKRKGFDPSRLTETKFETVTESGKQVTKATFKMVGKLNFYSTEPLAGNTNYYVVVDDDLKTAKNVKFTERRFKFQTGAEKPVLYTFEVKDGIIVGKDEEPRNITKLKIGDEVTIKAVVPQGKTFDSWNIGNYTTLTDEQKKSETMKFIMIDQDVYIWATFK